MSFFSYGYSSGFSYANIGINIESAMLCLENSLLRCEIYVAAPAISRQDEKFLPLLSFVPHNSCTFAFVTNLTPWEKSLSNRYNHPF